MLDVNLRILEVGFQLPNLYFVTFLLLAQEVNFSLAAFELDVELFIL